jgi:putative PIN family toxin of toxin-antitoxin system
MKVVLDTNVLIAALISRGVCADLLEHCVLRHNVVSSEAILAEVQEHLLGKFKYSSRETDEAVSLLRSQMEIVAPQQLMQPVCRDPDDDQILATAISAKADCIVTGDKDLLVITKYEGVEIIRPSSFADFETGGAGS